MIRLDVLANKKFVIEWYYRKSNTLFYKHAGYFIVGIPGFMIWIVFGFKCRNK